MDREVNLIEYFFSRIQPINFPESPDKKKERLMTERLNKKKNVASFSSYFFLRSLTHSFISM